VNIVKKIKNIGIVSFHLSSVYVPASSPLLFISDSELKEKNKNEKSCGKLF